MMLQPHEVRVISEKDELDLKIQRLGVFLNTKLALEMDPVDRSLLARQHEAMNTYSAILGARIGRFQGAAA